jgi:Ser/Thr protein kinase RdoA (MazF antagonist)
MKALRDIAHSFFQIECWNAAEPIGTGNINDTYRIDFEQGGKSFSFLLQRLNHQVFLDPDAVMRNICRVTDHLKTTGFRYASPGPIPTLNGQYLHRDDSGNYWRCFPFLPHTYSPEGKTDAVTAYEAARAYGAFARALRDFPAAELTETIPGFHDTDRRWEVFLKTIDADPAKRVAAAAPEIEAMFRAKPVFDTISHLKKTGDLPLRVTHNDTKAGNVLFDEASHKAVAVIDLDTVMPGTILSDFGDMVRTFVPDKSEDEPSHVSLRSDMLAALREGFLSETADFLSNSEREHLLLGGAWITGEQALRFLTDWLAGDVYYKLKYPEHNLVRARNQLSVFRELVAPSAPPGLLP